MRALRSFTVRPRLPEPLAPLQDLAMNLRWSWDERTRDLFRWVDPDAWEITVHDPVALLGTVSRARLEELAADPAFRTYMAETHAALQRYVERPRWFQERGRSPLRSVAYFSPEFGIAEALPQYSGGLGVLAGDHLKAASDLGLPLVGVGLFYRHGYFRQSLDADGWQLERYPSLDPHAMALTLVPDARVQVDLAGVALHAQVWRAQVGRIRLYMLDSDVEENDAAGRVVTDRLYGGDAEHRIRQEILLGMGGVRALEAAGEDPQVFHTNEGHAGFLGLERIRTLMGEGLSFPAAIEAVRASCIFTTHTPVPAGIDQFPEPMMRRYFEGWANDCGIAFEDLMALGHEPGQPADAPFNMAVMGLRLAGRSNAVARLHGRVSRAMFGRLWPQVPEDEVPITSVTNGVHADTWTSPEMDDLLSRHVLPEWHEAGADRWARVHDAGDDEVWRARERGRERLVDFVRAHLRASLEQRGASASDATWADEVLDPKILTVGFARRFATYKRATLLLSQPDRLRAMLLSPDRPVQFVFAGKAHPADELGKEMIRKIVQFSEDPAIRHRFVFVDDYDIAVARTLYQGADVWLNNPRRPQEACGTSGMKSALNGGLNCSTMDGWWDEWFDGTNGWAIGSAEAQTDLVERDRIEAESLFSLLEQQIAPMFWERWQGPVPRRWVGRVKASLASLGPKVTASRMVKDYVHTLYEPTAARADAVAVEGHGRAAELAEWKARTRGAWSDVHITSVDVEAEQAADLGAERVAEAVVHLGRLSDGDVRVELVHGLVGQNDELHDTRTAPMAKEGPADGDGAVRYRGRFACDRPGRYGVTVRVVPSHEDLAAPTELGVMTWA
jgi:starch phosphorylase